MELKIRSLNSYDHNRIKAIWEKHYSSQFEFPDFITKYLFSFAVTDDMNRIICAAGIRTIAEVVLMTNLDIEIEQRRMAFLEVLESSSFVASSRGYDQIHAFVQDEKWKNHLIQHGFRETKGVSLVKDVR